MGSTQLRRIGMFDPDGAAWMDRAACAGAGHDLFFPESGANAASRQARDVCAGCPVVEECLSYALRNETFGVWGGLTEQERRRIRRARPEVAGA